MGGSELTGADEHGFGRAVWERAAPGASVLVQGTVVEQVWWVWRRGSGPGS